MVHTRSLLFALAVQVALALLPSHPILRDGLQRWHLAAYGVPEPDEQARPVRQTLYPAIISQREDNKKILSAISHDRMRESMLMLTSWNNRHYQSVTGVAASDWIFEKIKRYHGTFKISRKRHDWPQRSIDVLISEGLGQKRKDKRVIVVGAHMDSISLDEGSDMAVGAEAPGADDNASGVAVLLEALYLLLRDPRTRHFRNEVHFHFYAAEEVGLRGSKDIFQQYVKDGLDVVAFLNQDMTGAKVTDGPDLFTIITDHVYQPLNDFLVKIINTYTKLGFKEWVCGYGCSDHASATRNGFPAAYVSHGVADAETASYIHTINDTLANIDYSHMSEHVKLVLGYVFELGFFEFGPAETSGEVKVDEDPEAQPTEN